MLILGETGTGKEVIARAIYQHSGRQEETFHAINCAAIPENLLESELFGHERGAFTGADQRRIGKFEICNGGTLFLDEIGDMSPLMQTKLLRVLQEKEFERVGSSKTLSTDVRIIAATNRDLETAMQEGSFRSDLYYRLNEFTISLPPLRDRGPDVELMIHDFFNRFANDLGIEFTSIAPETMEVLISYPWPGNVREMQGTIKQTLLMSSGPVITPSFLPANVMGKKGAPKTATTTSDWESALRDHVAELLSAGGHDLAAGIQDTTDRVLIVEVLKATRGNLSAASTRLGISRPTLRNRMKHLGIQADG